jgi:acyl carrier protein
MAALADQIVGILVSKLHVDEDITVATPFEQLELDSLVMLELAAIIERDFGVKLSEDEITAVGNVDGVVSLIEKYRVAL